MLKIVVIINTLDHKNHQDIAARLKRALSDHEVIIFDLNCCMQEHERYYTIRDMRADLIITLDMAGFEMKNIMGVISYDSLKCRMAHLLFDKAYKYSEKLECLQNLSMFTYIRQEEDADEFGKNWPTVPNVMKHCLSGGSADQEAYVRWFEGFLTDAHIAV